MIYTKHPLSKKLKDVSVNNDKPNWKDNANIKLNLNTLKMLKQKSPKMKIQNLRKLPLLNFESMI